MSDTDPDNAPGDNQGVEKITWAKMNLTQRINALLNVQADSLALIRALDDTPPMTEVTINASPPTMLCVYWEGEGTDCNHVSIGGLEPLPFDIGSWHELLLVLFDLRKFALMTLRPENGPTRRAKVLLQQDWRTNMSFEALN